MRLHSGSHTLQALPYKVRDISLLDRGYQKRPPVLVFRCLTRTLVLIHRFDSEDVDFLILLLLELGLPLHLLREVGLVSLLVLDTEQWIYVETGAVVFKHQVVIEKVVGSLRLPYCSVGEVSVSLHLPIYPRSWVISNIWEAHVSIPVELIVCEVTPVVLLIWIPVVTLAILLVHVPLASVVD